jgi:hypothetical protein
MLMINNHFVLFQLLGNLLKTKKKVLPISVATHKILEINPLKESRNFTFRCVLIVLACNFAQNFIILYFFLKIQNFLET